MVSGIVDAVAQAQLHIVWLTVIAALRPRLMYRRAIAPDVQVPRGPVVVAMGLGRTAPYAREFASHSSYDAAGFTSAALAQARYTRFSRAVRPSSGKRPRVGPAGCPNSAQPELLTVSTAFLRPQPDNGKPSPKPTPFVVVKEGLTMPF
jgi:hypothetical protein